MVTLPPEFVAIRYPGYFWNTNDNKLYTCKVSGILRPLSFSKASRYNQYRGGYYVSVFGSRRFIELRALKLLKPKDQVFPVHSANMQKAIQLSLDI